MITMTMMMTNDDDTQYDDDQNQSDLEEGNDWGETTWKIVLN